MGHGGVLDDGGAVPQIGQGGRCNALLLGEAMFHDLEPPIAHGGSRRAAVGEVVVVVLIVAAGGIDTLIGVGTASRGRGGRLIEVETARYGRRRAARQRLLLLLPLRLLLVRQLVFSQVSSPLELLAALPAIEGLLR